MFKLSVVLSLMVCIAFVGGLSAQDAAQKTKDLVAALDKTKYKKKEKKNVSIEVFVDIKNEAAVKADPAEYSGRYEMEGYQLLLTVAGNGVATGSGFDTFMNSDKAVNFELKNARVDGALLTGTKIYENGRQEPFEAVFVNRNSRSGSNPNSIDEQSTKFGVGFIQTGSGLSGSADNHQNWSNRVFLERR